jgi:hypothetical protein
MAPFSSVPEHLVRVLASSHIQHGTGNIQARLHKQCCRAFREGVLDPFFLRLRQSRGRKDLDSASFVFIAESIGLNLGRGTEFPCLQREFCQGRVEQRPIVVQGCLTGHCTWASMTAVTKRAARRIPEQGQSP